MCASPVDTDAPFNVLDSCLINVMLNGEQKPIACLVLALFQIGHQFLPGCESKTVFKGDHGNAPLVSSARYRPWI